MKKLTVALTVLLALVLAAAAAQADRYPVNPQRGEAMRLLRYRYRQSNATDSYFGDGFSFRFLTEPAFDCEITVEIIKDSSVSGDFDYRVQVYDTSLEEDDSLLYDLKVSEGNTFTLPPLVLPTEYDVTLFIMPRGTLNIEYYAYQTFTLEPDASHPTLDARVTSIVNSCRVPGNDWQTALNLHDWLTHHAYYDYSYSMYGPDGVLFKGTGVCDSYAKAYTLLMREAGISAGRVISTPMNHAWNEVCIDGIWAHVDVTWDDAGDAEIPVSGLESHHFYCVSDEFIQDERYHDPHYGYSAHACTTMEYSAIMRLDEEWQEVNTYIDGENHTGTYTGLFQEKIDLGETDFDVNVYEWVFIDSEHVYDLNAPVNNAYFTPVFHLLALVQSAKPWQDAAGNPVTLSVSYNQSDRVFHVEVSAAPLDLSVMSLTLPVDTFIASGKEKCPVPVLEGGEDLTAGVDYEIVWTDNVAPGTATVTVQALGDTVTGSISAEFTILPAGTAVCAVPADTAVLEAEAFLNAAFTEIILPDIPVTVGANCFAGLTADAVQITVPDADSGIDPLAFDGLRNVTLIAPASLTIGGIPVSDFCAQQGWYYEAP
ncbi:MAG: transglutaminase domain-containing protein [Clostridia bacterium]|nr:transglutaminase domain-containing protein [Clostridia bacterium]